MIRFYSILRLQDKYSPAVLASAIEQDGIYFKNDTLGSIKEAKDDGDAWQCGWNPVYMQKIIYHTGDEKTPSKTTKSRALVLLDIYSTRIKTCNGVEDPMQQAYRSELANFGWDAGTLPNFEAIQQGMESPESPKSKTTKTQKQHAVISDAIKSFGYDPLCIPQGGKAKIEKKCLKNKDLFTTHSFKHAWKAGKKATPQLWEVENPDQYKK